MSSQLVIAAVAGAIILSASITSLILGDCFFKNTSFLLQALLVLSNLGIGSMLYFALSTSVSKKIS